MAGHSKFKNIMHRKGAQDARRAKKFARLIKELQVAARSNIDPESNPRLRTALSACKSANMPKDNIQRVLNKVKSGEQDNLEDVRYEGYGPGGSAIIVEALTNNRNRTASEVRSSFTKYNGNLGESGTVSYLFKNLGLIIYENNEKCDVDQILDFAIENGASDVNFEENKIEILSSIIDFNNLRDKLEAKYGLPDQSEISWIPEDYVNLDEEKSLSMLKFLDALDNCEDVQNVFGNFNLDPKALEKIN